MPAQLQDGTRQGLPFHSKTLGSRPLLAGYSLEAHVGTCPSPLRVETQRHPSALNPRLNNS